ncbi:MAG TPA: crossover junction endodeoxyribonuclease RuvC [Actinomycetota bacterium]|nr:crossover junction endodeoxyribonuclease RuvC [Actinomycetota bacterium]
MLVMGVDPGLTRTGYAIVTRADGRFRALGFGVLGTPATAPVAERLALLRSSFLEQIARFAPDEIAIERLFFNSNVRTAMSVGQASGVLLASAAESRLPVAHYTPPEVKMSVAGSGTADKSAVASMVMSLLGLDAPPRPADAADACALAICHLNRGGLSRAVARAQARSGRAS